MDETRIYTLFLKYKANRLSASEYEELKAWLSASAENEKVFERLLAMRKRNIQYEALSAMDVNVAWSRQVQKRRFMRVRRWVLSTAVAALVAGCCWIGYNYIKPVGHLEESLVELFPNHGCKKAFFISANGAILSQKDSASAWFDNSEMSKLIPEYRHLNYKKISQAKHMEIYVPRGGEYLLELADGTKVWLNSQSILRFSYPFDSLRTVYLEGEAYFEVAQDGKRPFEVVTEENTLRVLGTKFNVRAYPEQPYQVTLAEGKIKINTSSSGLITLLPDEQLSLGPNHDKYEINSVNAELFYAWTKGIFEFNDTSLEEIGCQLERWYNVKVDYASDDLKTIRFTGSILRNESLGYALELIQKISDVRFSKRGNHVLVCL